MAVPSAITDLSTTVASNSPAGSESPSLIDDYLRAQAGFLAQMYSGNAPLLSSVAGTDTITGTVTPTPTAYAAGQVFRFISAGANTTTAVTLNVSSLGAKSVTKLGANALAAGDIPAGAVVQVVYDGTRFQIVGLTSQIAAAINTMTSPLTITVNGTTPITADTSGNISLPLGTANQVQYLNGSKVLSGSANLTFDGTTLTPNALTVTNAVTLNGGTANGVPYLNASKVLTSGSALTFDGTTLNTSAGTPIIKATASTTNALYGLEFNGGALDAYIKAQPNNAELRIASGRSAGWGGFTSFFIDTAEQMRLTSTGLGIGTSSPGQRLDVVGQARVSQGTAYGWVVANSGAIRSGSNGVLQISADTANAYASSQISFDIDGNVVGTWDTSGNLGLGVTPSAWTYKALQIGGYSAVSDGGGNTQVSNNASYNTGWKYRSSDYAALYEQGGSQHRWYTAPSGTAGTAITFTQAMTLDAIGNLGLGVTPSAWDGNQKVLQSGAGAVYGYNSGAILSSNGYFNSVWRYINSSTPASYYQQTAGAHSWYTAPSGTAGTAITFTQAMTLDASGNLVIGTTAASQKLHVYGSGNTASLVESSGGSAYMRLKTTAYEWTLYNNSADNSLVFYDVSAAAARARIDSSGNLLVGTTTAEGRLTVTTASNTTSSIVTRSVTGDLGTPAIAINKFDNNTTTSQIFQRFTINNGGSGSGQINANGASQAAFGSYSDVRLKENIVNLPSQLSNIMALRPVEFDYIEAEGGGHQIGFIAQEFETVYPDSVGERADGMKTLTGWNKTEARLVKAIQEQQAIIESLTSRIAALEAK